MSVTDERDESLDSTVTQSQRDVTYERDTLARARPFLTERVVTVVTRDSDTPLERDSFACRQTVTQDTPAVRREKDRQRLAADPRFGLWVAGSRS
jgi:hypothetical protein